MRQYIVWLFFAFTLAFSGAATAQQSAWVQIEAQPSLRKAQERVRAYAGVFDNVNGFSIGSGWYAIALGPYTPDGAIATLDRLRRENLIPRDSFIADGRAFRQQFWPIGANTLNSAPQVVTPQDQTSQVVTPPPPADETPRQARKSEARLTRDERRLLQTALQWEGYYNSAIDGAFGRGTRNAMAAYQEAMGYEATGILTTKQRQELVDNYNAVLAGIGMAPVRDEAAGIEISLPTALVEFAKYQPPFAHYNAKGDSGVRVLLISQTGDQNTLFGLYDIMQTLEIVPLEGPRERRKSSFELTGQNDKFISYTFAQLKNGMVKGFTLIWPTGDEKRRNRVLKEMKTSFTPFGDTALPDNMADPDQEQSIDLLAGLEIRKPVISRSGFYVDAGGRVLTTVNAVQNCKRITLDDTYEADLTFADDALGIALLTPRESLSPATHANFRSTPPRLKSEIAVAGYSYEGALGAATLTFGTLADIRGLKGETELRRLVVYTQDGDVGGPVFDMSGSVLGMLLPKTQANGQRLPDNVSFALGAEAMGEVLAENGVTISASQPEGTMPPEDLTTIGTDMTVLVSCWD
ncbi:MAG TPA: peptidoglycan-binding protein [Rhodobacteraceae bacterium]|nr:peptidoglycan-binding protein [Paracoccaceae bacterium]